MSDPHPGAPVDDPVPTLSAEALQLFQQLPFIGMAVTSPSDGRWVEVNQTLCDMLGYGREELTRLTWADVTHPDDLPASMAGFERVMQGESDGYKVDKRYIRRDGTVLNAILDVKAVRRIDGSVDFFIATVADISARVQAEASAREAERLLGKLARQVPGVIYQYRLFPDGRSCFPFASEGIRDIYAVTPEEVRDDATRVFERIHPEDIDAVRASIERSATTLEPWRCDYRVILPERGVRWLTGHARPELLPDGGRLWHGYIADATEHHLAREALLQSEQRFRIQVEHAPEAIVVYDVDAGRFADANSNAEHLFGISRDRLLASSVADLSPERQPDGRLTSESGPEYIRRACAGEAPVFEWSHLHSSGTVIPCEVRLVHLPSEGRTLVRGSITDVSESRRARDDLLRLQAAIDSSISGIAISDLEGRITYANRAFLALWGHADPSEVLGSDVRAYWRHAAEPEAAIASIRDTGSWTGEMTAVRVDGAERVFQVNASHVPGSQGRPSGMLASFADVTDARILQAQLLQARKLESVGRLAGGVAHDFNNLLTVIKGYLEDALATLPPESELRRDLLEVDRAADSAVSLTRQLLAFSRRQVIAPVVLDLNQVVRRVEGMLRRSLGENIVLEVDTDPAPTLVRFDAGQAEQVVVNLALNARDAMPSGGRLRVRTANVRLEGEELRGHPGIPPGDYVSLVVSDTGAGMTPEARASAFEPFFTTKEPGRGTGLGLAMIHGAVTQGGGAIELDSVPGRGSTFRIYLPRTYEPLPRPSPRRGGAAPRGDETILLVEDDSAVRGLAIRLLGDLGYRVHAFAEGQAALDWLEGAGERVHLLLTDVVMPGMSGPELAVKAGAVRPDLRVVYTTGYAPDVVARQGILRPDVEFLAKPYTLEELATRIRAALDAPAEEGNGSSEAGTGRGG